MFSFCGIILIIISKSCESALFFPTNTAYGIFGAIAVPLDLPNRNVFLSYNFEANYNMPATWYLPPIFQGDDDFFSSRQNGGHGGCLNCTEIEKSDDVVTETPTTTDDVIETVERARRSLLSRTDFYHILIDKFNRTGLKGEECLLRLICEVNSSDLGNVNGVLGSLMHVIFSPSSSMRENLPNAYYNAEFHGINDQCIDYELNCAQSILDLISAPISDIFSDLQENMFAKIKKTTI